ncbi:MAG: hypothetical protein KAI76_03125, partial [Alphaproteobacteria bacterium]|nr:hypothetical protein [Alphaproteobacteria bacterium]
TPAMSANFKNSDLLNFPKSERDAFYTGAAMSISHVVALYDEKQGQCFMNWYLENPNKRIAEIEKSARDFPDHAPTSIIIGLAQLKCGKINEK